MLGFCKKTRLQKIGHLQNSSLLLQNSPRSTIFLTFAVAHAEDASVQFSDGNASDVEADPAAVARGDGAMSDEESIRPVQLPGVFDLINDDPDILIVEQVPAEPHVIDAASNSSADTVISEVDSECIYDGTQNVQVYLPGSYVCMLGPPCELDYWRLHKSVYYTLGLDMWLNSYTFLTIQSRCGPPNFVQILNYPELTSTDMGKHRDAFTKVGLERVMNGKCPDIDFYYSGCANSQVFGSNVLIWTAVSPMTMTWSFPNPNYPPDQETRLYLTFDI
jgi:hypothetical protein